MEINTNNFIDNYFEDDDIFFVFLLNRTNELKTTKKTQSYYCNKKQFYKHYSNYQKWNKKGIDLYFSLNTFQKIEKKIFRQEKYIKDIRTLFFDIDTNAETIRPKIILELGLPTYEIQTSENKYQLLYCLNDTNIDNETFKNISKTLTYHFKTDTTFDTARVSRMPENINNKNGFNVKYSYNDIKYSLKHFETYIGNNKLLPTQKKEKKKKPSQEINIPKAVQECLEKEKSNSKERANRYYLEKYDVFLEKNNNDYSSADFSFVVYLIKAKKLKKKETVFKHFLNTCRDVEKRHSNIQEYFNQIFYKITE
jgi:hypothetical protein